MLKWPLSEESQERVTKGAVEYLIVIGQDQAARVLLNARIHLQSYGAYAGHGEPVAQFGITLLFPPRLVEKAKEALGADELAAAFSKPNEQIRKAVEMALDGIEIGVLPHQCYGTIKVAMWTDPPVGGWRQEISDVLRGRKVASNQATVSRTVRQPPFQWNGLQFQSKTEVKVAEALSRASVLFFPLPAAVAGMTKREPDFLVCADGKWGILEVQGDEFHPPETAAREHERGRWFQRYGIRLFQIYDAARCYSEPDEVVAEFLALLRPS